MKLPRRTYYHKPKKKLSDQTLVARMEQICLDFPRYGYRRVTKQLQREGWTISHKKVARIMREKGWSCRPRKRKWICTTDSNHNFRIYPNLTADRSMDGINQLWVADITYIHILVCFVYLAVILDVYSRKADRIWAFTQSGYTADTFCVAHGHRPAQSATRLYSSFGSWCAICVKRLYQRA